MKRLMSVAFSPTGWRIATGSLDGTVRTYNCTLGARLDELLRIGRRRLAALHG